MAASFDFVGMGMQAGMIIVIIVAALIFGGLIGFTIYALKKKKTYGKYNVIVWKRYKDKDGREIPIIDDMFEKGGILKDKVMNKFVFHLKNANLDMGEEENANFDENRELDIPSIPCNNKQDVVFVEKLGNRKYAFGEPFIVEGKVKINVSEADLAEAKRSYAVFVKTFGKKSNPIWAFVMYVIFAVLIMVLIFVVLNKFELIVQASENFRAGAEAVGRGSAIASGAPA